ncbi:hypothetical protein G4G27_07150 [Sphingomonas sp. So64.6b]|uniref:hypothetical protein n=1 Tax=Sphingomonas sp. So64.6b TaxID=2997354 RepID=UPI0015FF2F2D|nr:hypothetical protein [Sphingomonas sp. So64.6b]QNA83787.1 hypothetical protein G4G27_07150 [Sphingomonas sp. So64.6b]
MSILYTPGQVMAALSLSKQQWRTYRSALPHLNPEAGRSACFNAGDLLAAAVVQAGTTALQMSVSAFSPVSEALFELCSAHSWPRLERAHLVLIPAQGRVVLVDSEQRVPACALAVVVELAPLVAALRERLLALGRDPQHDLAFPPMVAGGRP